MVVVEAYFFIRHVELVLEAADMAHKANKILAFSISAAYLL